MMRTGGEAMLESDPQGAVERLSEITGNARLRLIECMIKIEQQPRTYLTVRAIERMRVAMDFMTTPRFPEKNGAPGAPKSLAIRQRLLHVAGQAHRPVMLAPVFWRHRRVRVMASDARQLPAPAVAGAARPTGSGRSP